MSKEYAYQNGDWDLSIYTLIIFTLYTKNGKLNLIHIFLNGNAIVNKTSKMFKLPFLKLLKSIFYSSIYFLRSNRSIIKIIVSGQAFNMWWWYYCILKLFFFLWHVNTSKELYFTFSCYFPFSPSFLTIVIFPFLSSTPRFVSCFEANIAIYAR